MTVYRLTVQAASGQSSNTRTETLDGRVWRLTWYTSTVDDAWFLDLVSDAGEAINGIPVSARLDMLEPYRASDVPPGQLWAQTTSGRAPRVADFESGVAQVYYQDATP